MRSRKGSYEGKPSVHQLGTTLMTSVLWRCQDSVCVVHVSVCTCVCVCVPSCAFPWGPARLEAHSGAGTQKGTGRWMVSGGFLRKAEGGCWWITLQSCLVSVANQKGAIFCLKICWAFCSYTVSKHQISPSYTLELVCQDGILRFCKLWTKKVIFQLDVAQEIWGECKVIKSILCQQNYPLIPCH